MSQHALDDIVGAFAMLSNPLEIPDQEIACLREFATPLIVERRKSRRGRLVEFVQEANGKASEVVDEIERVLDFVGDAGGQLTE
jgi:hypothetical protein